MQFRIADTFTDSLARLTGEEQKSVKITALDLQLNPAHPSLQFHKLEKSKDKRFSSVVRLRSKASALMNGLATLAAILPEPRDMAVRASNRPFTYPSSVDEAIAQDWAAIGHDMCASINDFEESHQETPSGSTSEWHA
jgi:hypothetical protein